MLKSTINILKYNGKYNNILQSRFIYQSIIKYNIVNNNDSNENQRLTTNNTLNSNNKDKIPNISNTLNNNDNCTNKTEDDKTIIITNLPLSTTESKIKDFFKSIGDIYEITFLKKKYTSVCYVHFISPEFAKSSLSLDGSVIDGNFVNIKIFDRPKPDFKNNVIITNLSQNTNKEMLRSTFQDCGKILEINLYANPGFNYAVISFESNDSLDEALLFIGSKIDGNNIDVTLNGGRREDRSVFLSKLTSSITEDKIKKYFESCGRILEVLLGCNKKNGRFCILGFATPQMAKSALDLNGKFIDDYCIDMRTMYRKKYFPQNKSIFVYNLTSTTTEEMLRIAFQDCIPIIAINFIKRDASSGKKSFAIIGFGTSLAYKKALELKSLIIDGNLARIFIYDVDIVN